jgi:hypothetical protein
MPPVYTRAVEARLRSHGLVSLVSPLHLLLQTALALIFFVSGELDRIFNLSFALVPVLGIPAITICVAWIIGIIRSLRQRDWRRTTSVAIVPLIVWPLLIFMLRAGFDAHWARFQINKRSYETSVRALHGSSPAYHSWDWGSTGGAAAVNIFYALVYDESDQISSKADEASKNPTKVVRNLGGHFYLVTDIYQ